VLRSVVSGGIADGTPEFRSKMATDITRAVNAELDRLGMKITNVEIIELWSRPGSGRITVVSH
jgi:regulator of protease activity HflC (stomatin/prohibitin superfamily)